MTPAERERRRSKFARLVRELLRSEQHKARGGEISPPPEKDADNIVVRLSPGEAWLPGIGHTVDGEP